MLAPVPFTALRRAAAPGVPPGADEAGGPGAPDAPGEAGAPAPLPPPPPPPPPGEEDPLDERDEVPDCGAWTCGVLTLGTDGVLVLGTDGVLTCGTDGVLTLGTDGVLTVGTEGVLTCGTCGTGTDAPGVCGSWVGVWSCGRETAATPVASTPRADPAIGTNAASVTVTAIAARLPMSLFLAIRTPRGLGGTQAEVRLNAGESPVRGCKVAPRGRPR